MQPTLEESPVLQKTKELCQTILDQPNMLVIRQRIDAFMGDDQARTQYDGLVSMGQTLQEKQQMSLPLTPEEIDNFQKQRDVLLKNPIARDFLDAQEELQQVQRSVQHYVSRTLELGRMPSEEEVSGGCGGHGTCGCGHGHNH